MPGNMITIKQIVSKYNIPSSTINHYTLIGLLTVASRKKNMRLYDEAQVKERLARIAALRSEGYPLNLIQTELNNNCNKLEIINKESEKYLEFVTCTDDIFFGEYDIKNIILFCKYATVSGGNLITIYADNNLPLIIEYDIGDLGRIRLLLKSIRSDE